MMGADSAGRRLLFPRVLPRPRPRPRDQRRPRQEEEDRGQVPRAGGDAREAGVGRLVTNTLTRAFTLQLRK